MRDRFHLPAETIYMLGNSLGLVSVDAERAVARVLEEWRNLGIGGWLDGNPPWFWLAERLGERAAALVGAQPDEVISTGTTTANIHSLASTFYRPEGKRTKILAAELDFPTDIYALKSQIALRGLDWRDHLVLVPGDAGGIVDEEEIIRRMTEEVALVQLPSVFYRSGQLLDMRRLTEAAHERGIQIGFDCSHSVGVVPHSFDEWSVDFAVWCSYKYLNGGPGAPAFIYINSRHFDREPGLAGWFGYKKDKQFDLHLDFDHARCAGGWQISSTGILGAAALEGALEVIRDAGIESIREKSLKMTSYLIYLADELLSDAPHSFKVATPRTGDCRGGHMAVAREREAMSIKEALRMRSVVADFRPPDIIRLAPSPLYTSYGEIWTVVRHLREIIDGKEYEGFQGAKDLIT
jgi:kynureninase